jgi:signal transduction histidine kinase
LGLTFKVLPIGTSFLKIYIEDIVHKWRSEQARKRYFDELSQATSKTADFTLIFNQLHRLVELIDEKEIVKTIFDLLILLFSPSNLIYTPIVDNKNQTSIYLNNNTTQDSLNDSNCFTIEFIQHNESLAFLDVIQVSFPQYTDKYKEMAEIISEVCSLAIANARKFNAVKFAHDQIIEYSDKLEKTNSEKDKFFSIIAHDLRSPLSGFLGLSAMLSENIFDFSMTELETTAKAMNDSAKNLNKLLINLLEWSRMKRGLIDFKPESLFINSYIKDNVDLLGEVAKQKEITIDVLNLQNIVVYADSAMLNTVIRNLISNAIKFTYKGGNIVIGSVLKESDNCTEIYIKDNGIGMDNDTLDNIFKLDTKVSRPGTEKEPSTGLGLILCKESVEKHGGRIWAESEVGKGSTFYFTLPIEKK